MTDHQDPLDAYEPPSLAEQVEPYRKYGDGELAVALLHFGKKFGRGVPALSSGEIGTFEVRCQPANTGATHVCSTCDEEVRLVVRPDGPFRCPACGERVGVLELGRGVPEGETDGE